MLLVNGNTTCTLKRQHTTETMSALFILFAWTPLIQFAAASIKSRATFTATTTGIDGYIDILLGHMYIDLDFSALVADPTFYDQLPRNDCLADGIEFNIHTEWNHTIDSGCGKGQTVCQYDKIGQDQCSSNYTSGHLDTWFACSSESSSEDCIQYVDGCIEASTSWSKDNIYTCDNDTFRLVPYSCEIGDLSGKYGKLNISYDLYYEAFNETDWQRLYTEIYNSTNYADDWVLNETDFEYATFAEWKLSIYAPNLHVIRHDVSFWEVGYEQLSPTTGTDSIITSLVMNCGNGDHEPVFCAPFLRENDPFTPNELIGDQVIDLAFSNIDYNEAFNEYFRNISLADPDYENWTCIDYQDYYFGNITYSHDDDEWPCIWQQVTLEISESGYVFTFPEDVRALCNEFTVWLHDTWNSGEINATLNDECNEELIEYIWDPTHSCILGSGSKYCSDGKRCNQTVVDYEALCGADNYYCAVGDISSRVGVLTIDTAGVLDTMTNIWTVTVSDDLSAPLYAIPQRSIRLECVDTNALVFPASDGSNDTFKIEDACAITIQTEGTVVTGPPIITPGTRSPTTPAPSVSTTEDEDDQGEDEQANVLSGGAVAGIVIGVIVGLVLIGLVVYFLVIRPKQQKGDDDDETTNVEMN